MTEVVFVAALFMPGSIVATTGAEESFLGTGDDIGVYLIKHLTGDWGDLCDEDKKANDDAVKHGDRILSAYHLSDGTKIWVITEWDRSVTTFLLPEEY